MADSVASPGIVGARKSGARENEGIEWTAALKETCVGIVQRPWLHVRDHWPFVCAMLLFNPVLLLHLLNATLSLCESSAASSVHNNLFDTWVHPHLDVHADDGVCKALTVVLVALQLGLHRAWWDKRKQHGKTEPTG